MKMTDDKDIVMGTWQIRHENNHNYEVMVMMMAPPFTNVRQLYA